MQFTNANEFSFDEYNSLLLVGMSGTGKSVLEDRLIDRLVKEHERFELQFALLDMTGVDFWDLRKKHPEYILSDLKFFAGPGLSLLEHFADMSDSRAESPSGHSLIIIMIEECDMASFDHERFVDSVVRINNNAKDANMKLIYSTSRPGEIEVPKDLLHSFELILAGELAPFDYANLELLVPDHLGRFEFAVHDRRTSC